VFLKSIQLFGFKSFADRSSIEFRNGISALLGPNGCGKSNVVDAIKWVLGEQSTRTLRAEKMEDVIFNGTESRKALNVAEVTLTLSNDDGTLPIEIPEIEVKRRLHRSGESEYFINSTPVKLREVRELFFDTGIGKSSYSIMEQGKIDQILSNKPEERRYIFEEAAGITKYKLKGAEAERKLQKTEENMRQVEGILREVKRSYDSLKVQSEKTVTYRSLKDLIFDLELDIQLLKLKGILDDQHQKDEKLKERSGKRDELRKEIDTINNSLEQNLDQVNSMESRLIEAQKRLYGIDIEKNNRESRRQILTERSAELERQAQGAGSRQVLLREKMAAAGEGIAAKEQSLKDFDKRIEEVDQNISSFTRNIETASVRIGENEKQISAHERALVDLEKERDRLQLSLREITDDIVTQLDSKLKETGYSRQERAQMEEEILTLLESLLIQMKGKRSMVEDALALSDGDKQKTLEHLRDALESSSDSSARLSELFKRYRSAVPSFIDEFLAPEGIITRKRDIDAKIEEAGSEMTRRRREIGELREENRNLSLKIDEYRRTLEELRISRAQMDTQKQGMRESLESLRRELSDLEKQLAAAEAEVARCKINIEENSAKIRELEEEHAKLAAQEKELNKELSVLESGIQERNKELLKKEGSLKQQMEQLGKVQSQVEQLQMSLAALQTEIKNIYDNFRDRHSRDLNEYDSRMFEIRGDAKDLREELNGAREGLKALGQVNLMAPEEFSEVKERFDFLNNQLEDLYKAREDLTRITKQIRVESTELFLETYEKIKKNFHSMFRHLFGGGRGELQLTEPDQVLTSGIEIFAQPPGKKLENISLLSGGERSLTAVAMLFATYMVKPSPFCILDEIDAALDESNVGRFINVLMEFGKKSQFIIITHNKKTVAGARTLLGVTMEESGVSKVIAVRLAEDGNVVEEEAPETDGVPAQSGI
jgi:chromosome segregation protein